LFVGNLSFDIDDATITKFFADNEVPIESVNWVEKEGRFKGCGFVTLAAGASVDAALKLQGQDLMGRPIKIEQSNSQPRERTPGSASRGAKVFEKTPRPDEGTDTLFVGNLSFQITEEGIRDFFKDSGEVIAVRWIEKEGQFKGLGFVQFDSVESADSGMKKDGEDCMGRAIRIDYSINKSRDSPGRGGRGGFGGDRRGGGFGGGRGGGGRGFGGGGFGGGRGGGGGFGGGRGGRGRGSNPGTQKRSGSFNPEAEPANKRMKFSED